MKQTTLDEYLEVDWASEHRYEFLAGFMRSLASGTFWHGIIVGNLVGELGQLLRRSSSQALTRLRVRTASALYTYADIIVICGEPQFEGDRRDIVLNPSLVIEVLSPSSEAWDRGQKFEHFRSIPTLQEYVLVAQDHVHVEHFLRQPSGQWLLTEYGDQSDRVQFPSLSVSIAVSEIYAKVDFPLDRSPFADRPLPD